MRKPIALLALWALFFTRVGSASGNTSSTRPAVLTTTDGRVVTGSAQLEDDAVTLTDESGRESFRVSQVTKVKFPESPQALVWNQSAGSAAGLKAEYFDDQDLQRAKLVRYDPTIDFRWGLGSPDPSVAVDFSARWSGRLEARYSERYAFFTHANKGVRFWIDGKLLIDQWYDRPPFDQQASVALEAGRKYDIRIEYHNQMAEASARLEWRSPSQARQVVPASRLSPPVDDRAAPWRVTLVAPSPDRWRLAPTVLDFEATVTDARATTRPVAQRVDFFSGPTLVGSAATAPYRYAWAHVPPGHHSLTARAVDGAGTISASPPVVVDVAGDGAGSLAAPWGALRIGTNLPRDHCSYSGGLYTIHAGGGELRAAADAGYFVGRPLDGDGQITARIGDLSGENAQGAVAGVTLRESLSGDSRAISLVAGKDGAEFLCRWDSGAWSTAEEFAHAVPCYLRLVRSGDIIRAFLSDNGSGWQLIGSEELALGSSTYVGLIATSRSDDATCTVTADHVQVSTGSAPMDAGLPGVRLVDGTFLAGQVRKADDKIVRLARPGSRDLKLDIDQVARLIIHPLSVEALEAAGSGQSGVLLGNGDFFEGSLRSCFEGRTQLDSVVFGEKHFASKDVVAVLLRDVRPDVRPTVRTRDGCVYRPKGIEIRDGLIQFQIDAIGHVAVSLPDLVEVTNP